SRRSSVMMKWLAVLGFASLPAVALGLGGGQDKKTDHPKPPEKHADKPAEKKADKPEAKVELGKPAPAFELKDLDGKSVKLSDYKDKIVVLEWFNPECPFVVHQHTEGVLKEAASKAAKDGVVWLAINSSAAGQEGNGVEKNKKMKGDWKM